jgi:hypothetical protein
VPSYEDALQSAYTDGSQLQFEPVGVFQDAPWYLTATPGGNIAFHSLTASDTASAIAEAETYLGGLNMVKAAEWKKNLDGTVITSVWFSLPS